MAGRLPLVPSLDNTYVWRISVESVTGRRLSSPTVDTQSRRQSVESVRHQLRPLFDQVVVKELDSDRMRRSGLVVPAGTHDPPPQQGIVLAVGPGLDWWEQAGVEMPVQPGDHVVFPASAGVWIEVDEERLLVCRVVEFLGILESAAPEPGDA
jgi:chaperonin GroES